MKNVILTHKELQFNLFEAVTRALMMVDLGSKDLYLSIDNTDRDYIWQVSKAGNPEPIYWCYVGKGDHQMNDMRLGVTVNYLHEKAEGFIDGFKKFYYGDKPALTELDSISPKLVSFGEYLFSDDRTKRITEAHEKGDNVPLGERLRQVYHADIENWKETQNADLSGSGKI